VISMLDLKKIKFEYRTSAVLGFSAFVLSLLTGIIMGFSWNTIVLRSFVLMAVFAGMGLGISITLKTYVPEVYELFTSRAAPNKTIAGAAAGEGGRPERTVSEQKAEENQIAAAEEIASEPAPPKAEPSFNELDKDMLSQYSSAPGRSDAINTAEGKLGKHVLKTEKLAKYEPKVMAQAVRTMMSKDQ
jgi:predicted lipid-binding transport protein (Tim44 family)